MPYLKIFQRLILRPLRQEPARTGLAVAAVALGVAAVLAIELAGEAAAGSFRSSMETLIGKAGYEASAAGGLAPEALRQLASLPYALKLHPRIEDYAVIESTRRTVPLVGIDFLAEAEVGPAHELPKDATSVWTGSDLPYKPGDRITLIAGDSERAFTVQGRLGENSGETIVMDLAQADELLHRHGRLDRILIESRQQDWLRDAPPGMTVQPEGTRTEENRRMLAAFRWNLRVLSYISLAVGAFLIYNTISVSVVRRRAEIGILRALGATRAGVLAAFLGEAGCLGLLGAVAGIGLGRSMAVGAVRLVASTVESLYVSSRPAPIALSWESAVLALAIGVVTAALSALAPAWEAAQVAPVEAMGRARREHEVRLHRGRDLAIATALAGCAWVASRQPPVAGKPMFGYAAALLMVAASALAMPAFLSFALSKWRRTQPVEPLLASRGLLGSLRRSSVLAGALSTAVAMLAAVGIMVGSFRETVARWMGDRIQADLYLRPAVASAPDRNPTLCPEIAQRISGLPEVAEVDQLRTYEIEYDGLPATLAGASVRVASLYGTRGFLSGAKAASVFAQLAGSDAAIVSEPFANKHHVRAGGVLHLKLGGAWRALRVIDIYYDYSNERGTVFVDRATLLKYLPDPAPSNLAVYLKPGVALDDGRRAVEAALGDRRVIVATNRALREEGLRVFDRTFAITYALEAVAVFVAVMGVGGSLLALVIDRRREFGLLKFLGAADPQIRRMILFEAGFLGLLSNAAGLILGFLLSLLLIYVINKQSFGWTIQFHWPVAVLSGALSVVYAATLLAGLYPARIATGIVPIEAIHEE